MIAWTADEWSTAKRLRQEGKTTPEIATALRRAPHSVHMRFYRMARAIRDAATAGRAAKRDRPHNGVNTRAAIRVRARMTNPTPHRTLRLTAENVRPVLTLLIGDGHLSPADVERAAQHGRQIARIEAELARLRGEARATRTPPAVARKPFHMTPAMARARRTQGRYLGALKRFPSGTMREKAKAIAKDKGVPAAVAFLNKQDN